MGPGRSVPRVRAVIAWTGWAALLGLAGALLGDAAYALLPGGSNWRERRLARRILRAVGD